MLVRPLSNQSKHAVIAAVTAAALLFSQWLGLLHNFTHLGWQDAAPVHASDREEGGGEHRVHATGHAHHSCILFDAATLCAALHAALIAVPSIRNRYARVALTGIRSSDARRLLAFSSRAPPPVPR